MILNSDFAFHAWLYFPRTGYWRWLRRRYPRRIARVLAAIDAVLWTWLQIESQKLMMAKRREGSIFP
ncbi:MAG TPA: hypothetical protein VG347_04200 [Verrucomicrobiae bacterium]|nr:hypothetical protein [Verrucomicrobiae bacterium]